MVRKRTKGRKVASKRPKRRVAARVRKTGTRTKTKKKALGVTRASKNAASLPVEKIGEITHYFPKVKAAAAMIVKKVLRRGDAIYIKGHTTDFKQAVTSMQMDHVPIEEGRKGQEIGLLVKKRVRIGDSIYRV